MICKATATCLPPRHSRGLATADSRGRTTPLGREAGQAASEQFHSRGDQPGNTGFPQANGQGERSCTCTRAKNHLETGSV